MAPKDSDFFDIVYQRQVQKKTHASFPRLKYPSLRDEGFRDPVQWLTGKAMDDGAEGLWRVHDGIYDLESFVKQHPGGAEWLELTKGTDITEAFECHHLNPVVYKVLEKYYVRDATTPRNSPFTFKEDGFYRSLKKAVYEEVKKVPKGTAKKTDMIIDGLFITYLIASALSCWAKDYWVVMISYLVASLALAWTTVAAHNYIHRKTNWRMYLFNFSLWSYRDFRVSHALSHHLYPNTVMDLEMSAFEPFVYWSPNMDKTLFAKLGFLNQQILHPFLFFINFLKKFLLNFLRKGYFKNHYHWHNFIGFSVPILMSFASGVTLYEAFIMWLWIHFTGSFIFFTIGANAAHHHPKIFKDGDEVRDETPDWGVHELEAVMDRSDINGNLFKVMTFFGDHALHHLFPTLDHGVLPYLYPVFFEHCRKYNAKYRTNTQFQLVIAQIQMTLKDKPNLLQERDEFDAKYTKYS